MALTKIIMKRTASDDFFALLVANAMLEVGADVFSIIIDNDCKELKYQIYCKTARASINVVDKAIDNAYKRYDETKTTKTKIKRRVYDRPRKEQGYM